MNLLRSLTASISMLLAFSVAPVMTQAAVDTTQPITAASLAGTTASDGWYTTSVTVALSASDGAGGSGVAKTEYSLDGVTWQTYSGPLALDSDGIYFLYFRSTDWAGNVEAPAQSRQIKINRTGLVGHWRFDADWRDASAVGNDLQGMNGVTFSAMARAGAKSAQFDGVDDGLIRHPFRDFPAKEVSVEFWINTTDSGKNAGLVSYATSNSDNELLVNDQRNLTINRGPTYLHTGVPVNDGKWHHVVVTWRSSDGGTKLYKDGVLVFSGTTAPNTLIPTGGSLVIGSEQDSVAGDFEAAQRYSGLLDEVAIYNRVLSEQEVLRRYGDFMPVSPTVDPVPSPTASPLVTLSGMKPANSAIVVNGDILVPLDASVKWQASYTLASGINSLTIAARDSQNFTSVPVTLSVVLDTVPPAAPAIDAAPEVINSTTKIVTGTKSSDSTEVVVGCAGAAVGRVFYPTATTWNVNAYDLKEGKNTLTAYAVDAAGNRSGAVEATVNVDTVPPAVSATPAGGVYRGPQTIVLAASEPSAVYYTLDGSAPSVNTARYTQPITITAGGTLRYFARDAVGNSSEMKTEAYLLDAIPPVLAVSTLGDGAFTNSEILNVSGSVKDDNGVGWLAVNGSPVQVNPDGSFSYALLLKDGANTITVTSADIAGNETAEMRSVTLDRMAPVLVVATPADNAKTREALLQVSGSVDNTSAVSVKIGDSVEAAVLNGTVFTAAVVLEPGFNTVEITAIDLAGNRSSLKRTVVFDDQAPSLAVISPNQDIRTNQSSLTIRGTEHHALTAVGVTISMDNEVFEPTVVDGTFEQVVNFRQEKTYGIVVTATNEVGTATSVQRNVIYDITPPVLGIDPVNSPTGQSSLSITGTREAETAVAVTSGTATVGDVSYPTATTWQAAVSGLREGANVIQAASVDAAGNAVAATTTVVLVTRPPEITLRATPEKIWAPNRKMVPVTISGGVETFGSELASVVLSVRDEYGKFNYDNLAFGSTVMVEASRKGNDKDGRKYTITAVVTEKGGKKTSRTATVTVGHDASR